MKPARKFAQVSRRLYRPEQRHCPVCQKRLRRAVTLSERTVITLEEVIKLVHAGYRCPDPNVRERLAPIAVCRPMGWRYRGSPMAWIVCCW